MAVCHLDRHEQWVLEHAEYFTAVMFLGQGQYERHECPTRATAVRQALSMATALRGALVYAVTGPHQALTDHVSAGEDIMSTILVSYHDYLEDLTVVKFDSRDLAEKAVETLPNNRTAYVVDAEAHLAPFSLKMMQDIFNALRPEGVAPRGKFKDRSQATSAVVNRLIEVAKAPVEVAAAAQPKAAAKAKAAATRAKKGAKKGAAAYPGVPVRTGSGLAKIVGCMIAGNSTLEQIAATAGCRPDQAKHRIGYVLRVKHGIGHAVNAEGKYSAVLPAGFDANSIYRDAPSKAGEE